MLHHNEHYKTGQTRIKRILDDPNKEIDQTYGTNGVLAKHWRIILAELNITTQKWLSLMADFVYDLRNGVPNNKSDQTSFRGNLTKELSRDQLTWKSFCRGLRFLKVRRMRIVTYLEHENGHISVHESKVDFGQRQDIRAFMEATEPTANDSNGDIELDDDDIIEIEDDAQFTLF